MIVNKSMFPVQAGYNAVSKMTAKMTELQTQFGSGKKAATLADMGRDRLLSLNLRARSSVIETYQSNIKTVNLRLDFLDKAVSRLDVIEAEARTSALPGGAGTNNVGFTTQPALAKSRLDEVVQLLNTNVNNRYLLAGTRTDTKPVPEVDVLFDGEGGKAGFKTVARQRLLADLGTEKMGRLDVTADADSVTLTQTGGVYGFVLGTPSATGGAVSFPPQLGSPAPIDIQFDAVPQVGDEIRIGLTLPDGTETAVTLKAVETVTAPGQFAIGADIATTAANFEAGLESALKAKAQGELTAASTFRAADDFFNASGDPIWRVDPVTPLTGMDADYENATGRIAATAADTVAWYQGGSSADPRRTATAKVDDSTTVSYGVEANEFGLNELVKALASVAVSTFPDSNPNSLDRFNAVAERQLTRLSESHNNVGGSIEIIAMDLGVARSTAGQAKERHTTYAGQLETLLADAEDVNLEQIAMEILALKTRLEASYQTMAVVSDLTLVNYIR